MPRSKKKFSVDDPPRWWCVNRHGQVSIQTDNSRERPDDTRACTYTPHFVTAVQLANRELDHRVRAAQLELERQLENASKMRKAWRRDFGAFFDLHGITIEGDSSE